VRPPHRKRIPARRRAAQPSREGFARAAVAESATLIKRGGVMTVQAFAPSIRRFHEDHKLSFWQQLLQKIVIARQQEASEYVAEYLRRHEEYQEKY
jgi:hypothetical protein